jgi:hypothetical protein
MFSGAGSRLKTGVDCGKYYRTLAPECLMYSSGILNRLIVLYLRARPCSPDVGPAGSTF